MGALVFDADDTLWENNFLFERVVEDFLSWLDHPVLDRASLRAILDDVERANSAAYGYGSQVFLRSLSDCLHRLRERPASAAEQQQILSLATDLIEHRIELMPGVGETLIELSSRHQLFLLTKGDESEQRAKLEVSQLEHHFRSVHIVAEKNVDTYLRLERQLQLDPAETWMIGNSPKSDILPARRAGWNAVFIPNPHTWALEHQDMDPDEGVVTVQAFTELPRHL
jgi:putative hydrolase of the HAD superfamily